jgi:hypothetical protein
MLPGGQIPGWRRRDGTIRLMMGWFPVYGNNKRDAALSAGQFRFTRHSEDPAAQVFPDLLEIKRPV